MLEARRAPGRPRVLLELTDHSPLDGHAQLSVLPLVPGSEGLYEGLTVLLDEAIARLGLRRIYVSAILTAADAWGHALGDLFDREGTLVRHVWCDGQYEDVALFGVAVSDLSRRVAERTGFAGLRRRWRTFEFSAGDARLSEVLAQFDWSDGEALGAVADSLSATEIALIVDELTAGVVQFEAVLETRGPDDLRALISSHGRPAAGLG